MSTHFFGMKDWTFTYSHSVGRNEFAGTGFRNPVDLALGADDVVYVINRSYENRPDGIHVTMCTLNEEYITEFGSAGEGDGQFTWPTSIALRSISRRSTRSQSSSISGGDRINCRWPSAASSTSRPG